MQGCETILRLVADGGPRPSDFERLDRAFGSIARLLEADPSRRSAIEQMWARLGEGYLATSIQGRAFRQRYGYAGDFATIDRIYRKSLAAEPRARRWDEYFHAQAAPCAVRNRKRYFKDLLEQLEASRSGQIRVLDLGSGPCRDLREYFDSHPDSRVRVTCVDQDPRAIRYARRLCRRHLDKLRFVRANVLRYRSQEAFDLVWSAGVMDYLDDRTASLLLSRCRRLCAPDGEVIVGNFSASNPSRSYMEVAGRWYLKHRTVDELRRLTSRTGLMEVRVDQETLGVNLFLRARPKTSVPV